MAGMALTPFGCPLGFMAIIGPTGLVGVAINDSIVVLAAISENDRDARTDRATLVTTVISCTRHIVATTLTTIAGEHANLRCGSGLGQSATLDTRTMAWPPGRPRTIVHRDRDRTVHRGRPPSFVSSVESTLWAWNRQTAIFTGFVPVRCAACCRRLHSAASCRPRALRLPSTAPASCLTA